MSVGMCGNALLTIFYKFYVNKNRMGKYNLNIQVAARLVKNGGWPMLKKKINDAIHMLLSRWVSKTPPE
jgi:hypothetical protein